MRGSSIRLRLWSAAAISIVIALAIAGIGLRYLFERHVERRVESEITVDLNQLIAATTFATDGSLAVAPVFTDPRFAIPFSGYYWQVENLATGALARSRSLWDGTLAFPPVTVGGDGSRLHEISGPARTLLIAVERTIVDSGGGSFRAMVAEDHATITESVDEYVGELAPSLVLLAFVLLAAIFIQTTVGLAPLQALRTAVRNVIAGRSARLDVAVPSEIQPLADEINRLLELQEKALGRARSRATDLAHDLKTPLQVLSADIRTLRTKGETALADEIEKSAGAIRRYVELELTRARLAPGISVLAECKVAEVAGRIVSVVQRTPEGEKLAFIIDVPSDLTAPIDEGDLSEILGNLIENAARFAKSSIRASALKTAEGTSVTIADDGPGVADGDREAVLSRGVRLDSKRGGSGLGLAIVSDIVEAYGGRLTMGDAAPGLTVTVFFPKRG